MWLLRFRSAISHMLPWQRTSDLISNLTGYESYCDCSSVFIRIILRACSSEPHFYLAAAVPLVNQRDFPVQQPVQQMLSSNAGSEGLQVKLTCYKHGQHRRIHDAFRGSAGLSICLKGTLEHFRYMLSLFALCLEALRKLKLHRQQ